MRGFIIVSVFFSIFISCISNPSTQAATESKKAIFMNDSIIDTLFLISKADTSKQKINSSVRFFFPVFVKDYDWLNKEVQKLMFFTNKVDTIKQPVFQNYIRSIQNDFASYVRDSGSAYWYLDNFCYAEIMHDSIILLRQGYEGYSGGAHPAMYSTVKYFKLSTHKELGLVDFFKKASDTTEVRSLALQELRKMKELKPGQKLDDDAGMFVNDESFYLSKNFYFSDTTLSFYYNDYELQAYAFGPIEINLNKKSLTKLLK
jgi:hypothetical protein